jgi:hypothetical protein
VRDTHWIEDCGERAQFFEFPAISLTIVTVKHQRDISEFMLVPGHQARAGLTKFRKHHIARAQASLNRRIELAASQDLAGLGRLGHE